MTAGRNLILHNVTAGYGRRQVLPGLNCGPIPSGSVTALVGPNAAGKSTLLRVIAGLVPGRGSVRFGGMELTGMSVRERARHLSFMPQALPQDAGLSVIEVMIGAWRALPDAHTGADMLDRVAQVLDRLGLGDLGMRPLTALSGGQRQMVALGQALMRDPPLLLLDEPTSALDLRRQIEVMQFLRKLAREGRTILIVLHDVTLAARWADLLLVMRNGKVQGLGAPEEIVTPAMLASVYGVAGRVERCSQNQLMLLIDGVCRSGTTHEVRGRS